MGSIQHSQVQPSTTPAVAPPQVSPFQSRGFGETDVQAEAESCTESTTLQARLERAARLGHNFGNVQVISRAPNVQREEAPEEEEQVMMKPDLQMAGGANGVDPDLESSIQTARGGGQPMDSGIQRSMEGAFGADFSGVRIHTDFRADSLNRSIQAKAFTTGQDVFFRSGAYDPGSSGGKELLAHELTHVVQQSGGQVSRPQAKLTIGEPGDPYEREADATAAQVVQKLESETSIQRQEQGAEQPQTSGQSPEGATGGENEEIRRGQPQITILDQPSGDSPSGSRTAQQANAPTSESESVAQAKLDGVIQRDGGGGPSLEDVVNTAKTAWDVMKDNRPTATAESDFATAVPNGVSFEQMSGWNPQPQTIRISYHDESPLGVNPTDITFIVRWYYNGNYEGRGQFINAATVFASVENTAWGNNYNVIARIRQPMNLGSVENPIAALPVSITITQSNILQSRSYVIDGLIQGDGSGSLAYQ